MLKRYFAGLCCLCLLWSLCACSNTNRIDPQAKDAMDAFDAIVKKIQTVSTEEESRAVAERSFLDGTLTVPGMTLEPYVYLLFRDARWEFTAAERDGDTARLTVKMTNRYLPEALIYFWAWIDNEYVSFSDYSALAVDAYDHTKHTYTGEATVTLRYGALTGGHGADQQEQIPEEWGIVMDQAATNLFFGDILNTDYVTNGNKYLVTADTANVILDIADKLREAFDAYNEYNSDKKALAVMEEQVLRCGYYSSLLNYCYSANEFSWTEAGSHLLLSLQTGAEVCLSGQADSVSLEGIVDQPLAEFRQALTAPLS